MISDEYVAAFFDGEGTIVVSDLGHMAIYLYNQHLGVLQRIQQKFGGKISKSKEVWVYRVSMPGHKKFLESIRPHVEVKVEEVEIGLEVLKHTAPIGRPALIDVQDRFNKMVRRAQLGEELRRIRSDRRRAFHETNPQEGLA